MKSVLLIDDDEGFRTVLTELLRNRGCEVWQARDGEEGLKIALEKKPDLIICDLLMPRCNGFQFCRALKARGAELPKTRILVTSGSGYSVDRIVALESGADEFLTKPLLPNELADVMNRLGKGADATAAARVSLPSFPESTTRLKFWGVRGSIPAPGPDTVYYGGNTSCVEVRADGELIILDAGTGIRRLGRELIREFQGRPPEITILISHTHWDHIQGLPFFAPAYEPENRVRILGFDGPRKGIQATLSLQMESPYFPVSLQSVPGNVEFVELRNLEFNVGKVQVQAAFMNHPGVCVGYRLYTSAGSIVYFPDNELFERLRSPGPENSPDTAFAQRKDEMLRTFIEGADVVISDAQYDAAEYARHAGWGHSCVDDVVALALAAKVKKLFLFHHDPDHDDAKIAQMLAGARQQVETRRGTLQVEAAREGLEVTLPG